ncbi:hypothetical protein Cgig2_010155 [Carnegiea gigantea]|uniref:Threonylcarbamoyl-AMP synthase n=1 Tax=Carnegiea gigantea TaxID=171969 RepID=A0A9Q1KHX1_9CARY|nr:hypothetical protein Cgig2_010155 [Carnegiea gigantea]
MVIDEPIDGSYYSIEVEDAYLPPWIVCSLFTTMCSDSRSFEASFTTEPNSLGLNAALDVVIQRSENDETRVPRSGPLHLKQQRQNFSGIWAKMASGLGGCDGILRKGTGVVLPATEEFVGEAVEVLSSGKVIAVPTDTLYGFACDAWEAVNRIYEIKWRKHTSPLAICVGDVSDIKRFAATDHLPGTLLNALLPGPVTVVLRREESSILEKSLNPGLDSIGVRVPDCNFIRIVSRRSGSKVTDLRAPALAWAL